MEIFYVLFFISVATMAISLLLLIVRLIFKKGMSYKGSAILLLSSVTVFVLSGVMMPEPSPEQKARVEERKLAKELAKLEKEKSDTEKKEDQSPKSEKSKKEPSQDVEKVVDKKEDVKKDEDKKVSSPVKKKTTTESKSTPIKTEDKSKKDKKSPPTNESNEKESVVERSKEVVYETFRFSDDKMDETISDIEYSKSDKTLHVTVKGKDGWSDDSIGLGFREDSTTVYRELAKDDRIQEAWLSITFPMKDKHGNVSDEKVVETWMSRKTMDEINWKSFDYQNLFDVADGVFAYPQFQ